MAAQREKVPAPPKFATEIATMGTAKVEKDIKFVFQVTWSDNTTSTVRRSYEELFKFQCALLDLFPDAAGQGGGPRTIPHLPGKKLISTRSRKEIATRRLPHIAQYCNQLVKLESRIARHQFILAFFDPDFAGKTRAYMAKASVAEAAAAAGCEVVKVGYLHKKGELVRTFKKRHFVLDAAGRLCYYRSVRTKANQLPPAGIILMRDVTHLCRVDDVKGSWPAGVAESCCFAIIVPARIYYIHAATEQEAQAWLHAIAGAAQVKVTNSSEEIKDSPPRRPSLGGLSQTSSSASLEDIIAATGDLPFGDDGEEGEAGAGGKFRVSPAASPAVSRRETPPSPLVYEPAVNGWATGIEEEDEQGAAEAAAPARPAPGTGNGGGGGGEGDGATRPEWEYAMADGQVYYINTTTLETAWELPEGVVLATP